MVEELLLSDYEVSVVYATAKWKINNSKVDCFEVSEKELKSISSLKTPNEVLAVVKQKNVEISDFTSWFNIALDKIQDPGNLGTIIRTADWFGVKNVICSKDTVDVYNPKVLQATMGSFFRLNIIYTDLAGFFTKNKNLTVCGALLDGESIYEKTLEVKGSILLMGNESKGISQELKPFINERLSIPNFGKAESLNVSIATAIFCSEYVRS
jgi:TrmH family RNA methyltransferase